jgi:hypothetical protein
MAFSFTKVPSDGVTRLYTVAFPYLSKTHVTVIVGDIPLTTEYTWTLDNQVELDVVPASGAIVEIRRNTPLTQLVDYTNGSSFAETDLDIDYLQNLYINQETLDALEEDEIFRADELGNYDALDKKIVNLANGIDPSDVVNKGQLDLVEATANTANTNATGAVAIANTANNTANTAYTTANTANTTATIANTTANTANTDAIGAVAIANVANNTANTAYTTANTAYTTANTANTTATEALDKSWVSISTVTITNSGTLFYSSFPAYKEYKVLLANLRCTDGTGSRTSSPLYLSLYAGGSFLSSNVLRSLYTVLSTSSPTTVSVEGASHVKGGEILTLNDGSYASNNYEFILKNFRLPQANTPFITGEGICRTNSASSMKHVISAVTGEAGVIDYSGIRFTLDSGIEFTSGTFEIYGRN